MHIADTEEDKHHRTTCTISSPSKSLWTPPSLTMSETLSWKTHPPRVCAYINCQHEPIICISRKSPHHRIEVELPQQLRNSRHPRSYILSSTTPLHITLKFHFLPHYQPSHTMQKLHCAARIHSWNPEVQARASAHHHGQFQLGCVCSVRTIRTSVIISAIHKLRNTKNSASSETRAAAVVRTWARRPKANAAISRSWGSVASSILISGRTAPRCTMCTWRTQHFPDFKNQLWNKLWKSGWHSVSLHWLLHFPLASILHKMYNKSHLCFDLYWNMQHGPKGVRKNTNLHLALRICCCKLAQQESCLPLAFLALWADNNQIH